MEECLKSKARITKPLNIANEEHERAKIKGADKKAEHKPDVC